MWRRKAFASMLSTSSSPLGLQSHAGIGPARDPQPNRLAQQGLERLGERPLDGPKPGLDRPAGEAAPVVLEVQPQDPHDPGPRGSLSAPRLSPPRVSERRVASSDA